MNSKILIAEVSSLEADLQQFAGAWRAAETGKEVKAFHSIGFADAVHLLSTFTPQRWVLIRTLKESGASSIYALAKLLNRNYSNVHSDVSRLLELGIAEKDTTGKVFVPWDEIDVQLPLHKLAA